MHDAGFKTLFSHPRMIEFLIRRHIPEYVDRIDFNTLRQLPTELIGPGFVKRYPDMLWRAQLKDEEADLLLPLEFQRRPEQRMASRTTVNNHLAAEYVIRHDKQHSRKERALVVRSLVLHHGNRPWNAPTRAADLFKDSAPDTYQVVSRRPPGGPQAVPLDLPEMVLRLGPDWTPEDMRSELPEIRRVVEECGDEDFDRFMADTLREMLELGGYESEELKEAKTMDAVTTLYGRGWEKVAQIERVRARKEARKEAREEARKEGRLEGRLEGREEGREQGQELLLCHQATRKFGPETAGELSLLLGRFSDPEQMARVADAILDCDSSEDFIARVREA